MTRRRAAALAGAVLTAVLTVMGFTAENWVPAMIRFAGENKETVKTLNVYGESLSYFFFGPLTLILSGLGLFLGHGKDTGNRSATSGERSVNAGGNIHGDVKTGDHYEFNFEFGEELYEASAIRTSDHSMLGMVPALPETFVGREEDLAELKGSLKIGIEDETSAPVQVLTAVHGWPGVGKTTVAAALARDTEVEEMFPDGVLFASLGQEPEILSTRGSDSNGTETTDLLFS